MIHRAGIKKTGSRPPPFAGRSVTGKWFAPIFIPGIPGRHSTVSVLIPPGTGIGLPGMLSTRQPVTESRRA
ncbi:hypothetical protein GCM10009414_15720 [Tatumella terrea]